MQEAGAGGGADPTQAEESASLIWARLRVFIEPRLLWSCRVNEKDLSCGLMAQLGEQKCKVWQFKRMCFVSVCERHLWDNVCMKPCLWNNCGRFFILYFEVWVRVCLVTASPRWCPTRTPVFLGQEIEWNFAERDIFVRGGRGDTEGVF